MDIEAVVTSLISGLLPTLAIYYFSQSKEDKKEAEERRRADEAERNLIKESHQAMLRSHILWQIDKDHKKGYRTESSSKNVEALYRAYHRLNGNGVVTEEYLRFTRIPMKYD